MEKPASIPHAARRLLAALALLLALPAFAPAQSPPPPPPHFELDSGKPSGGAAVGVSPSSQ